MIRRIALLVVLFILSLSASALAAEPDSGIIEGWIVNGTAGGSSVANQDVALTTELNGAEVSSTAGKTDADGHFVFDGLSTGSGYSYQVVLTFQQAEYYSEWLAFDEGETTRSVEVTVYDSTTSDEAIKVLMSHTVVYLEQGGLRMVEFYLFVNEADRTYIGSKEVANGTRETLRFSLPDGATELQPASGLMECCIYNSEDGFIDTMPVLPGGKEVAYSYRASNNSGTYTFSRKANYPIADFDLLVEGEGVEVTSDQLITEEPLNIEGTWLNHLSGSNVASGDIIVAYLSGLPQTNNQGTIWWVVLTLAALGAGFAFVYWLRRGRPQPAGTEGGLEQRRQGLLAELARLDDDFEDGKISEEAYRKLRTARKAQLVELMQGSKGESGDR